MPILQCEAQFPIPPNAWNALTRINGVEEIRDGGTCYELIVADSAQIESIINEARQLGLDVIGQSGQKKTSDIG